MRQELLLFSERFGLHLRQAWEAKMHKWLAFAIVVLAGIGGLGFWQRRAGRGDPQGWEYCTVGWTVASWGAAVPIGHNKVRSTVTATADICYAEGNGCKSEAVIFRRDVVASAGRLNYSEYSGRAKEHVVAEALAKLGAQGWELVGSGPDPSFVRPASSDFPQARPVPNILYLERPKP